MIVDFHCHTNVSDNSETLNAVLDKAKAAGIGYLAITNHDTTAQLDLAVATGKTLGIHVIPGIEISAYDFKRNAKAHILGLNIIPGHPALETLCAPINRSRHQSSEVSIRSLIEKGYPITRELVMTYAYNSTCIYKQHIMHALLDLGIADAIHGVFYKKIFGFTTEPDENKVATLPVQYVDAADAIRAIRQAGGVPVLAHPGQLDNWDAVEEWAGIGLEGIEVYHPDHHPQAEERAIALAKRYGLMQSGGSDYHGLYGRPTFPLGCKNAGLQAVEELQQRTERIRSLQNRFS